MIKNDELSEKQKTILYYFDLDNQSKTKILNKIPHKDISDIDIKYLQKIVND